MRSVLPEFRRLELLSILCLTPLLADILRDVYLPSLVSFTHLMNTRTSSVLPSFLNRHPQIKHLLLVPERSLVAVPLDPILLPNLTDYNGPAFALPAVDFASARLEWIFLVWGDHDLHIEPPLRHLRSLPSLDQFAGLTTTDHLPPAAILAGAATHLPHIRTLVFGRLDIAWHRTWTELLDMAAHLKKFSALSCLILIGADDGDSTRDHDIIEHWCEACKTLSSVSLHGRLWDLVDGCWKRA
ncbi:hypothetical protein B0H14DRAFT_3910178 [Mycena olivaceomarginata]|nr:hypothetical protein B0H14DRAFT_3910178 [Mycena olivaceomarginata]